MATRIASIVLIGILINNSNAQQPDAYNPPQPSQPPASTETPPSQQAPIASQPVPGILIPNEVKSDGHYVYEAPIGANARGCCHGVADIWHWLWYRALPVPYPCRHCKHYCQGLTPNAMDIYIVRYGYYNWGPGGGAR